MLIRQRIGNCHFTYLSTADSKSDHLTNLKPVQYSEPRENPIANTVGFLFVVVNWGC